MSPRPHKDKAWKKGNCAYCGKPIDLRYLTCSAHADLPRLDSGYSADSRVGTAPRARIDSVRG